MELLERIVSDVPKSGVTFMLLKYGDDICYLPLKYYEIVKELKEQVLRETHFHCIGVFETKVNFEFTLQNDEIRE